MSREKYCRVDILAVGAHPDDIELGCGGTLLKLRSLGHRVGAIDLTQGELGSRGSAETRAAEASRARQLLELEFRENLQMPDGNVCACAESRLQLVRVLRECCPVLVLTHSQTGHPDHWQTATLIREASHHAGLARIDTGQPRFRPEKIAHWLEFRQKRLPDLVVDISDFYERKEELIRAYGSQLSGSGKGAETYLSDPEFLDRIRSFHRHIGSLAECRFGEGFLLSRLPRVDDLMQC